MATSVEPTLTAPDASAQPSAPVNPFAAASEALKQKQSWAEVTPAAGEPVAPEAAAPEALPAEAEAPAASQYDGYTVDANGGLHRPDGTMASADEITGYNAEVQAEQATPDQAAPAEAETPNVEVVTLKARNGEDLEIEVTDPLVAETLRAAQRDGMRGDEYRKKMAVVEEHLAEKRAFERMLETNPDAVIFNALPEDKQVSLAVSLVAKYWDQIAPRLVAFDQNPVERVTEAMQTQVRLRDQQQQFERMTASERYAVQLEAATRALIPDHVDDAKADQFLADAGMDLGRAMQQRNGAQIPLAELQTILAPRLALYGFNQPTPAAPNSSTPVTPPAPPRRPVARPVASQPRSAQAAAPAQPTKTTVSDPGAAVRRAVTAQRVAAAVPPAGAGAATIRAPLVPANSTIEQASQKLRGMTSWGRAG